MPILGTKKFWIPPTGSLQTQKENQVLKNAGYINLQLKAVNYMSNGNFWQDTFGGRDKIAIATNVKYQKKDKQIEAATVQDMREVKVNRNYNLGIQRNLATKIPANADAMELEVKITAVKDDLLQAKFDMLNQAEYQKALQLAPGIVGQVFTVTSLVKKLFTDSGPQTQLEASYAGIISVQAEANPIASGKLTQGMLIMIATNDGDSFSNADEKLFELRGDALFYNNKEVENTYILFNISFEPLKGDDEDSNWFKKYADALGNLDKIQLTGDKEEIQKIYADSKTLWIEGNALIDADETYINREKLQIKNAAIISINEKYHSLTQSAVVANVSGIFKDLSGSSSFDVIESALPATGSFLNNKFDMDPAAPIGNKLIAQLGDDNEMDQFLHADKDEYINKLMANDLTYKLT